MNDEETITLDMFEEQTSIDIKFDPLEETTEPETQIGFAEDKEFLSWMDEQANVDWVEAINQQMEKNWR
jgi:hypothetical protein